MLKHRRTLLLLIFTAAFALRVMGLTWALPDAFRQFSYQSSELSVVKAAFGMNLLRGDLNPKFFDYGSHFIYLNHAVYFLAALAGVIDLADGTGWFGKAAAPLYLIGRLWSVFFSLCSVALLITWGRRHRRSSQGILAAVFLALCPLAIYDAHFATVDACLGFWVLATLIAYSDMLAQPSRSRSIVAGLLTGTALAVKYSALSLGAPVLAVLLLQRRAWKFLPAFSLAAAAAFLLQMPYALLDFPAFWRDFYRETFVLPRGIHNEAIVSLFTSPKNGVLYLLGINAPTALGPLLFAAALAGTAAVLLQGRPRDRWSGFLWLSCLWVVVQGLILANAKVRYVRYLEASLAPLCMLAASFFFAGLAHRRRSLQLATFSLLVLTLAATAYLGMGRSLSFYGSDTRDLAAVWLRQKAGPGDKIGILDFSSFRSLPLVASQLIFNGVGPDGKPIAQLQPQKTPYEVVTIGADVGRLQQGDLRYFALTQDLELPPPAFLAVVEANFPRRWVFEKDSGIFRRALANSRAPLDWKYVSPRVVIYER